ncbi:hypothetical protein FWG95_01250 [Candidatus Saccharibacteria bacterium]|nr:hypothetical protein [Candidatus Saccharibacteria bacterium]
MRRGIEGMFTDTKEATPPRDDWPSDVKPGDWEIVSAYAQPEETGVVTGGDSNVSDYAHRVDPPDVQEAMRDIR